MIKLAEELAIILGLDSKVMVDFYQNPDSKPLLIHPNIVNRLQELIAAAKAAGLPIRILSAYRDFERQKTIWNEKWQGLRKTYDAEGQELDLSAYGPDDKLQALLRWSAFPGLSRHHWGSDLDIFANEAIESGYQVDLLPEEFAKDGPCYHLNQWLEQHCKSYDFFRPYYPSTGGVSSEPWHISHRHTASEFLDGLNRRKPEIIDYLAQQDIEGLPSFLKAADEIFANFVNNIQNH